jgi:lysophospholipase L1-like esterase
MARQTKSTDILPLSAGGVLGVEVAPDQVLGVSVPLEDKYVLIPSETLEINERLSAFNAVVKNVADANPDRLAFADVNAAMKSLVTAHAGIDHGVTYTPNINPPTGIYSEEGLHPNSRGYAFIANAFIDAINAKFGASVPKANLGNYSFTALPINP